MCESSLLQDHTANITWQTATLCSDGHLRSWWMSSHCSPGQQRHLFRHVRAAWLLNVALAIASTHRTQVFRWRKLQIGGKFWRVLSTHIIFTAGPHCLQFWNVYTYERASQMRSHADETGQNCSVTNIPSGPKKVRTPKWLSRIGFTFCASCAERSRYCFWRRPRVCLSVHGRSHHRAPRVRGPHFCIQNHALLKAL